MTLPAVRLRWTLVALCVSGAFAQTPSPAPSVTPAIAGVVKAGTAIELVKEGFNGTEGPLPQKDGGILFTENRANRIVRIAPDGTASVWLEPSGGANALAYSPQGGIVATLTEAPASIGIVKQGTAPQVLAREFEGRPLGRPNDLVVGRHGEVWFSDPGVGAPGAPPPTTALYQLATDGKLTVLASDIPRPNGVALSPDERRLYVANTSGEWVIAFELDAHGAVKGRSDFAQLATPQAQDGAKAGGADGLAVDEAGRLYVASTLGVQVFSAKGAALGTIVLPKQPQNLAFAGKDRSWLYVVGRGSVYRIHTLTHGPHRAGK